MRAFMDVVEELWPLPRWTQSRGEELANDIKESVKNFKHSAEEKFRKVKESVV